MAWEVVPVLEDLRLQLNAIAPNRDKSSDGGVGDTSHAAGRSSHNPDRTGNPEYDDGDLDDEIRARDFDVDLRVPGLTARMVVNHLVKGAREGRFWWLRYIIYDGVIWTAGNGWESRTYTGSNPHDKHFHVNSQFNQRSDNYTGANYHLEELVDMPLTNTEIDKVAAAAATKVWEQAFGTNSTETRFPSRDQAARNYIMLGAIYGFDAVKAVNALAGVVTAIAEKVDLDESEINALKAALDVPTAEENAQATVEALGGVDTNTLANTLRSVLNDEQREALVAALSA